MSRAGHQLQPEKNSKEEGLTETSPDKCKSHPAEFRPDGFCGNISHNFFYRLISRLAWYILSSATEKSLRRLLELLSVSCTQPTE